MAAGGRFEIAHGTLPKSADVIVEGNAFRTKGDERVQPRASCASIRSTLVVSTQDDAWSFAPRHPRARS
jgi:hypothetical protein